MSHDFGLDLIRRRNCIMSVSVVVVGSIHEVTNRVRSVVIIVVVIRRKREK